MAFGGAALGALENHVFHEVRQAVLFGTSRRGTAADPHANRDGTHVGHGLGDDHEAVGQNVLLNVARFGGHAIIVTRLGGNEKQKKLKLPYLYLM